VSASLEAGGDDDINACVFQRFCLVHGGGRTKDHNLLATALVQQLTRRNAIDEAEGGNLGIQQNPRLILEADRFIGLICGKFPGPTL
jgi:hypothetical protein